jgi:hypothetical protein
MGASGQDSRAWTGSRAGEGHLASPRLLSPSPFFSKRFFYFLNREKMELTMRAGWWYRGFYSRQERRRRSSEWTRKLLWAFFSGCNWKRKKRLFLGSCLPFRVLRLSPAATASPARKRGSAWGPRLKFGREKRGSCKAAHASSIARFRGGMRLLLEIGPVRMCSKGMRNGIRTLLELAG